MSSNDPLIAMRASAQDIAVARTESAWNALLSGDLDAALAAKPVHVDVRTGKTLSARQAERAFHAQASAKDRPAKGERLDAEKFWKENASRDKSAEARKGRDGGSIHVSLAPGADSPARRTAEKLLKGQ